MDSGICLVEREYPDVRFVLELIHSARGVAVMAHPALYDSMELLAELAEEKSLTGWRFTIIQQMTIRKRKCLI